ncbi:PLP-dependent aminotransferase family protein [Ottowia sp.]|uniref:aminotransferase-like domain-containing protein n=1 Tax=Ottowia sp. TaxID=1898956 RepID=UPI002C9799DE|nr:PLP-dependent aminotransferase family protein [Ottowia sp.]HOB65646.1 PLP-dependent aminotransferase family protein [Ottowia sp.]HPZ56387.1 PLP-dependent aminotransferase family protein [Ottowia sp.]HQD46924.1 PLP-dependent aminotransferase family protein [Ottowia sp.]
MLQRAANQTLTEQLAERFAVRIRDRLLAAGTRLPSVRQCAAQHGVSPSTVVAAYDQLLAQGLLEARPQRGFYVRDLTKKPRSTPASMAHIAIDSIATIDPTEARRLRAPISAASLMRGMFSSGSGGKPQPGMGVLPPEWLDTGFMAAALRKTAAGDGLRDATVRYGDPQGDPLLRQVLAARLAEQGIAATPGQVVTTIGATQALDIVSRTLLKPGDTVMVEEPGWSVEFARLGALGMRMLPVPRGPDGPDLDVMARYCEAHAGSPQAPRLFVSVSVLHNPTGYSLSPASAHRLLQLAQRHDFHIVEDDTYHHLAAEHATRLAQLDGLQRTIYVSGFAKILAPAWRIGFLAAPPALVEPIMDTKLLATLTTPTLLERALALCIEQGQLRRHAERMRARLDAARHRSVRLAQQAGCRFAAEPAGLFGWVDTGVDTDALALRMLDQGYLLAPGALFHAARQSSTLMRINFATTQDPKFWQAFAHLRDQLR